MMNAIGTCIDGINSCLSALIENRPNRATAAVMRPTISRFFKLARVREVMGPSVAGGAGAGLGGRSLRADPSERGWQRCQCHAGFRPMLPVWRGSGRRTSSPGTISAHPEGGFWTKALRATRRVARCMSRARPRAWLSGIVPNQVLVAQQGVCASRKVRPVQQTGPGSITTPGERLGSTRDIGQER